MKKLSNIFCNILAIFIIHCSLFIIHCDAHGASVIATINGAPVTDADVTARTKLMAMQGQSSTDNRRRALANIIDDYVKLSYAESLKLMPSDSDVNNEIKAMKAHGLDTSNLSATDMQMVKFAIKANIAWQIIIGRTIMPTISISDEEIKAEKMEMERERGLPIEITFIRLVGIPEDIAKKLTKPESCDGAESMARNLGGAPQKATVVEYELSADVRARLAGLSPMTWSKREDSTVFLICDKKKTKEYGNLDELIKQNAMYKRAMFVGDQQLKQLRRKAVVVVKDERYK